MDFNSIKSLKRCTQIFKKINYQMQNTLTVNKNNLRSFSFKMKTLFSSYSCSHNTEIHKTHMRKYINTDIQKASVQSSSSRDSLKTAFVKKMSVIQKQKYYTDKNIYSMNMITAGD